MKGQQLFIQKFRNANASRPDGCAGLNVTNKLVVGKFLTNEPFFFHHFP